MSALFQFVMKMLAPTHPLRLALAIIVGLSANAIIYTLTPLMSQNYQMLTGRIGVVGCTLISIALFFFPLLLYSNRLSEDIEKKFVLIKRAINEGQLTKVQARMLYLQFAREEISNRQSAGIKKAKSEVVS